MEILNNVQVPTIVTNRGGLKRSAYLTNAQAGIIATLQQNQGVLLPLIEGKDPAYQARTTAHRIAMEVFNRTSNEDRRTLPEYAVYVSQDAANPGIMVVRITENI
jgi:hypothetical protein